MKLKSSTRIIVIPLMCNTMVPSQIYVNVFSDTPTLSANMWTSLVKDCEFEIRSHSVVRSRQEADRLVLDRVPAAGPTISALSSLTTIFFAGGCKRRALGAWSDPGM